MNLTENTLLQGGKYKICCQLGQGGFGITYLAIQTALDRKVAVKEFFMPNCCSRDGDTTIVTMNNNSTYGSAEQYKRKFIKEAKTRASLDNPHIILIHDVFEENGTAYYVMEYLEGGDLKSRVQSQGLPESDALQIVRQIAEALNYIHRRNILHLDIKPSNVLFREDDTAVLIDFGISKHYDEKDGSETSSTPIGISDGYAPLEQYDTEGIAAFSPTTDIYSLGATLYYLLSGNRPPNASSILNNGLPALGSDISQRTSDTINKAMSVRKNDRPETVSEFLSLLTGNEGGKQIAVVQKTIAKEQVPKQPQNRSSRNKRRATFIRAIRNKFVWIIVAIIAILPIFFWIVSKDRTGYVDGSVIENYDSQSYDIVSYIPKDLETAPNGVYAVNKEGKGVPIEFADWSCVAVALIVNDAPVPQRFWIEKNGETDTKIMRQSYAADNAVYKDGIKKFYWGKEYTNVKGVSDKRVVLSVPYKDKDGETQYTDLNWGYLNVFRTNGISEDYQTWKNGAVADFNGKKNTAAIIAEAGKNTNNTFGNMATYCTKFNQMNTKYRDWYIPSCGQLALMCLNIDEINMALKKIGGKEISTLAQDSYWSSTECSGQEAWYVGFGRNAIISVNKFYGNSVRLIRDI